MSIFQIAALAVLAVLAGFNLKQILGRQGRTLPSFAWLAVWATGAVLVANPLLARDAAHVAGIGRGADLVFYCNVLLTLGGLFALWQRNRILEHRLTILTRELALATAAAPEVDGEPAVAG